MSSFAFHADSVAVAPSDHDPNTVGFSGRGPGGEVHLLLQRSVKFDEQDIALGMDTYHVEWCNQEQSGYGGISCFTLHPGRAEVAFVPSAAETLGGLKHLAISFQLTTGEHQALQEALGRIFEGDDGLLTAAAK